MWSSLKQCNMHADKVSSLCVVASTNLRSEEVKLPEAICYNHVGHHVRSCHCNDVTRMRTKFYINAWDFWQVRGVKK